MIAQTITTPVLDFEPVLPELVVVGAALLGLLYEAFARKSDRRVHLALALAGLSLAAAATVRLWDWDGAAAVLGGTVAVDRFSVVARLIVLIAAVVGLVYATAQAATDPDGVPGEVYPLVLFATSGMTLISAANDLIVVFLALEILSLSLYVLTGIGGRRRSIEASMKYFLLGAFSSAFFLYGVAMAYGATATTKIDGVAQALSGQTGSRALALLAMAFLVIGFGFKVSAAPFHMWTPDVYQGAPTPITAYMSAATKVAAFFALMRVLTVALQPLTWDWTPVIVAIAVISIVLGSIVAIAQTDVKRLLAYSSIAHAGFVLTAITAADATGIAAAIFYLASYAVMTLGAFGVVLLVERGDPGRTTIDDFAGLAKRRPGLAAAMTVFLLSLAGIPPTSGFIAKVSAFSAAVGVDLWYLVVVAVVASVVAAFFYLRVIVSMYMRPGREALPAEVPAGEASAGAPTFVVALLAAVTIVLGVFPGLLVGLFEDAAIVRW